jgi:hypothetical protein
MRFISSSDATTWDALAYGFQNPINSNYFKNQLQAIGKGLNEQAQAFFKDAYQIYDRLNGSEAMKNIRSAMKSAASIFQDDVVKSLFDIVDFQNATFQMQRWIMANPVVRQMYHEQKCDGYSDTYVDLEPGCISDNHYDYRRVMNGVVVCEENNEYFKIYSEDLKEGDRHLLHDEKVDILQTWEVIEMFMKHGTEDPTSPYGADL